MNMGLGLVEDGMDVISFEQLKNMQTLGFNHENLDKIRVNYVLLSGIKRNEVKSWCTSSCLVKFYDDENFPVAELIVFSDQSLGIHPNGIVKVVKAKKVS